MIICSNWHESKYEAWRQFNLEHAWKLKREALERFEWKKEPVVLEDNGRFKIEGVCA